MIIGEITGKILNASMAMEAVGEYKTRTKIIIREIRGFFNQETL